MRRHLETWYSLTFNEGRRTVELGLKPLPEGPGLKVCLDF